MLSGADRLPNGAFTMEKDIILKTDKENMLAKLLNFPGQCREAYSIKLEKEAGVIPEKIVFCGMGGSAIGGDIIKAVCDCTSKIPVFVNRDYALPSWTDRKTLVIAASYSGNTEETLSSLRNGIKAGSRLLCISSGGKLEALASGENIPFIKIPAGYPPRCAFGYLFFPVYRFLSRIGTVKPLSTGIFNRMEKWVEMFSPDSANNTASAIAEKMHGKMPFLYSDAPLLPAMMRWKTQIAENSKHLSSVNSLPEMNHNEIMAWRYPSWLIKKSVPVFVETGKEHPRTKLRIQITKEILSRIQPGIITVRTSESSFMGNLLYLVVLGDWISFYLAVMNRVNPTEIKEINLLKTLMGGK